MSGWPTRPSRLAYGPKKSNFLGQAGDPRYTEGAEESNLLRWQMTGLGMLGMLARVTFTTAATTGAMVAVRHSYSWAQDLNDGLYTPPAAPIMARTGVGIYTLTLPALGKNEEGTDVAIDLLEAEAHAQGDGSVIATATALANVITVRARLATDGSLTDTATTVLVRAG